MAAMTEEGVKELSQEGIKPHQIMKGLEICTVYRNRHLREITITFLGRVQGLADMPNCLSKATG